MVDIETREMLRRFADEAKIEQEFHERERKKFIAWLAKIIPSEYGRAGMNRRNNLWPTWLASANVDRKNCPYPKGT